MTHPPQLGCLLASSFAKPQPAALRDQALLRHILTPDESRERHKTQTYEEAFEHICQTNYPPPLKNIHGTLEP